MTKHVLTPIEQRFHDRISYGWDDLYDCWTWCGGVTSVGYGIMGKGRREDGLILAHRFSFEYYNQQKAPSHMDVCHTCNNRACVNPNHLYLGTRKDNMQQARMDGRLKQPYRPWSKIRRERYEAKRKAA